ncbi:MAG: GNAT family N-acetyltransferase [Candidatus Odinarchaeota archaeon]
MYSVIEINQNQPYFDCWDVQVEYQINNQLLSFNNCSFDQVFTGENISLKRAIAEKKLLRCFIDIGRERGGDFIMAGSVSLIWKPEEHCCYMGGLWIEPEFRGNGLATYILNEITNFADELGMVLTLHALPFISPEIKPADEDISKLKDYYRQFGFSSNSETMGLASCCAMERLPGSKRNN